jgi:signal transduction histidine kinase
MAGLSSAAFCLESQHIWNLRMTVEHNVLPRAMSLAVHELRTPVTVVSGYLRMLLREQAGPLTEKQKKMLEEADRSCGRLGTLVSEMSEFGKLEGRELALAQQEFDLAAIAEELASGMHEGSDRGVRLEVRCSGPLMVTGDRVRIAAAVKALAYSALRERGEPGAVIVECSRQDRRQGVAGDNEERRQGVAEDNEERHQGVAGDNEERHQGVPGNQVPGNPAWAVIAIGDEAAVSALPRIGPGTTPPFDEWRGGLGLALPVARRVIEAHGGALWSGDAGQSRAASALRLPLRT